MWYAQLDASGIFHVFIYDFLPGCLFAVIKCFMIGVNVWWAYLAPQNIPRAISVLTLGNKVILYCTHALRRIASRGLTCHHPPRLRYRTLKAEKVAHTWRVPMFHTHSRKPLWWMCCPGHAGVKGKDHGRRYRSMEKTEQIDRLEKQPSQVSCV